MTEQTDNSDVANQLNKKGTTDQTENKDTTATCNSDTDDDALLAAEVHTDNKSTEATKTISDLDANMINEDAMQSNTEELERELENMIREGCQRQIENSTRILCPENSCWDDDDLPTDDEALLAVIVHPTNSTAEPSQEEPAGRTTKPRQITLTDLQTEGTSEQSTEVRQADEAKHRNTTNTKKVARTS